MQSCIFCKIVANQADASIVCESSHSIAFLDHHQINYGHTLVVPKLHFAHFESIPPNILVDMMSVAQRVYKAIHKSEILCDAGNIIISTGDNAGQEIDHCHIHVVPRYKGDQKLMKFITVKAIKQTPRTLMNDISIKIKQYLD